MPIVMNTSERNKTVPNTLLSLSAIFMMTAILSACGGTTTDADVDETGVVDQPPASSDDSSGDDVVTDDDDNTKTSDLKVDANTDFSPNYTLSVMVDIPAIANAPTAYFNLCELQEGSETELDHDLCLIETSLEQGKYDGEVGISNGIDQLGAEIVFIDPSNGQLRQESSVFSGLIQSKEISVTAVN